MLAYVMLVSINVPLGFKVRSKIIELYIVYRVFVVTRFTCHGPETKKRLEARN